MPLVTDSSTLAPSEVNANTELYMRIWFQNSTALLFLLVKKTSSSCGVEGIFDNRTLSFSQHKKNCGLLLDFTNRYLIHIFVLQNPHIMSISPQSHRFGANASSFSNNCNASLPREGCARAVTYYIICRSWHRRLLRSCDVSNGLADFVRCLTRRSLCRWLRRSCVDSNVFWLNFAGTLICGTRFSKESICS
jgi:hypothetical protein